MITLNGIGIAEGIALGKTYIFHRTQVNIFKDAEDSALELANLHLALRKALIDTKNLYKKTLENSSEEEAAIFEAQEMILMDEEVIKHAEFLILEEKKTAVYAVLETGEYYADIFLAMDDYILKTKAMDIRSVASLLVRHLSNKDKDDNKILTPSIVLSDNLMPNELVELGKENILGIVIKHGSAHSHVAILAASMNIPCIVCKNINLTKEWNNKEIALDAFEGLIFMLPEAHIKKGLQDKLQKIKDRHALLLQQSKICKTVDGERIYVNANISNLQELELAIENNCDSIGLFRSEFQYIGRNELPTEEELFEDYRYAASKMGDKRVVIRTLDLGSDKQVNYIHFPDEANPALGYRGIRVCLDHKDIFKTQLRAIYRASYFGNIAIMFPMISSLEEIQETNNLILEVKTELSKEMVLFKEIETGIMVETPAAAVTCEELSKEVNFISAGTNDLFQYTMAADRDNINVFASYRDNHPAIMKMLKIAADGALKQNIRICICGELAKDTSVTQELLDMGFTEFSVTPSQIAMVKDEISHCTAKRI